VPHPLRGPPTRTAAPAWRWAAAAAHCDTIRGSLDACHDRLGVSAPGGVISTPGARCLVDELPAIVHLVRRKSKRGSNGLCPSLFNPFSSFAGSLALWQPLDVGAATLGFGFTGDMQDMNEAYVLRFTFHASGRFGSTSRSQPLWRPTSKR
jgi:hypothetical protein